MWTPKQVQNEGSKGKEGGREMMENREEPKKEEGKRARRNK
jgi:hypothetical protein